MNFLISNKFSYKYCLNDNPGVISQAMLNSTNKIILKVKVVILMINMNLNIRLKIQIDPNPMIVTHIMNLLN